MWIHRWNPSLATSVCTNGKCKLVSISKIVTKKCVWMSRDFTPGLRTGLCSFIFSLQQNSLNSSAWTLTVINMKEEHPSSMISSSQIKHWEKILEVVRVLGLQSEVRTDSIRYRMMWNYHEIVNKGIYGVKKKFLQGPVYWALYISSQKDCIIIRNWECDKLCIALTKIYSFIRQRQCSNERLGDGI